MLLSPIPHARREQRGSTLILSIVVLSGLLVLALSVMQFTIQGNRQGGQELDDLRTLYLAEAGLAEACAAILHNADGDIGSFEAPVRLGDGLFWVEATEVDDEQWLLEVTALQGSARLAVEALVQRTFEPGGIPYGLFSERRLKLKKNVRIDSWDSDLGDYASQAVNVNGLVSYAGTEGNVGSNEGIQIEKDVHVYGDLKVGPGGEIDWKKPEDSYLEGEEVFADSHLDLPPVEFPAVGPSSGKLEVKGDDDDDPDAFDLVLGPGDLHFDEIKLKKKARVKLIGPARIVAKKKVDLDGSLVVDGTNGPVAVYIERKLKMKKSATVETLSGSAKDFYLLAGSSGVGKVKKQKIDMSGSFTGVVYAPRGHVKVKKSTELFGSMMAYSIKQKGLNFHYDEALSRLASNVVELDERVFTVCWRVMEVEDDELRTRRGDPFELLGVQREDLLTPGETWEPQDDRNYGSIDWNEDFPWVDPDSMVDDDVTDDGASEDD